MSGVGEIVQAEDIIELDGDALVVLRVPYMDVLEQAAALDGFDNVGDWMLHFVTYWGSELTAAANGDDALARKLMGINMQRARKAA